jgi:alkanesulfonate monooxygenase
LYKPYPPLFFGGSSEGALVMGAAHCDVFAMYGEPLADTQARMHDFRLRVAAHGRPAPGFNMSFRPIIAPTEGQAWDKADQVLNDLKAGGALPKRARDASAERLVSIAARGDVHDERLWMPVAALAGGLGNSTCLVGTPEQVAQALLRYYRLGIHSFLIRGFDPVNDVTDFGRELIPRLRLGAAEIDATQALPA